MKERSVLDAGRKPHGNVSGETHAIRNRKPNPHSALVGFAPGSQRWKAMQGTIKPTCLPLQSVCVNECFLLTNSGKLLLASAVWRANFKPLSLASFRKGM